MRPKQWVKNVLVLAAPFAGGDLFTGRTVFQLAVAFVAFSLAASGIYLVNDAKDVEADRVHPKKRHRPIAAGIVPPGLAFGAAVVLMLAALGVSWLATRQLMVLIAVYVAVQLAYCFWLKHQPVLDICIVASGFLLRADRRWCGHRYPALPVVPAVRRVRVAVHGGRQALRGDDAGRAHRREDPQVAGGYSASYLRFVWALSATVLIMNYCLWAFEIRAEHHNTVWSVISIVPFVVAVLRYAVDVDSGNGGEPEEIALRRPGAAGARCDLGGHADTGRVRRLKPRRGRAATLGSRGYAGVPSTSSSSAPASSG